MSALIHLHTADTQRLSAHLHVSLIACWYMAEPKILSPGLSVVRVFLLFVFVNFGDGSWWQAEAWIVLLTGAVEVNALVQGALRRFTQWPWIEHPTFQLTGVTLPLSYWRPHWAIAVVRVVRSACDSGIACDTRCVHFPLGFVSAISPAGARCCLAELMLGSGLLANETEASSHALMLVWWHVLLRVFVCRFI